MLISNGCNKIAKIDHWLGKYFNIMALIRTVGVVFIILWSVRG